MTLVDAKYDNFTRFFYDAVTPVCKLLFEKKKNLVHFGIKQRKLQRAGPNRTRITDFQKIKKPLCVLVFIVIFETYIMLFIKNYTNIL